MRYPSVLFFSASLFVACDDGIDSPPPGPPVIETSLTAEPAEGNSYGEYLVTVTAADPIFFANTIEDIQVNIGDTRLVFLERIDDFTVRGLSQGHPAPSNDNTAPFDVSVKITVPQGVATQPNAFRYLPPASPVFNKIYSLGASFAAAIQSNSLNTEGQLHGPLALAVKQAGAYFGHPLATAEGLPHRPFLSEINRSNGLIEINSGAVLNEIIEIVGEGGRTFSKVRADPTLQARNLAIPGAGARHMLFGTGTTPDDLGLAFFDVFNQAPGADVIAATGDPTAFGIFPPIEVVEDNSPTMILSSMDFFGNDVLGGDDVPTSEIEADLEEMFRRASEIPTRPPFFTLMLLDVNGAPLEVFEQDERYEVMRANAALLNAANRVNAELIAQDLPPRIFVGDFFSPFFELLSAAPNTPVTVAGLNGIAVPGGNGENDFLVTDADGVEQRLGLDLFEGLISLDGLHLTNTGYALVANQTITLINQSIGPNASDPRNRLMATELPLIDVAEILANDPLSPKNLEAERLLVNAADPNNPINSFDTFADAVGLPPLQPFDRCALLIGPFVAAPTDPCPTELLLSGPQTPVGNGVQVEITATVRDQNGNLMPNIPVQFFIDRADDSTGRLDDDAIHARTLTDANGVARATFTGGFSATPTKIQAQAGGEISSVLVPLGQ